jgi:hypothetical protein
MFLDQVQELDASLAERARASQHVEFYQEAVYCEARSKIEGYKVYENRDYVKITQPGGRSTFVGEVKTDPETKQPSKFVLQYPKQWTQYKAQLEQVGDGIPIEQWAQLTKAQVLMLKSQHIHTIEQCAGLSDGDLARLGMGFDEYRKRAKLYLDNARGAAPIERILSELNDERRRHAASEEQMKEEIENLKQLVNARREIDDTPAPRRGRPPKTDYSEASEL